MSVIHRINGKRVNRYRRRLFFLWIVTQSGGRRIVDCVPIRLCGLKTTRAALRSIAIAQLQSQGVERVAYVDCRLECHRGRFLFSGRLIGRPQLSPAIAA